MDKENLLISTLISTHNKSIVNVILIDVDAYCTAYKLKRAQVFAISMKELEFQATKEAKLETDLKSVIPEKYHDFLDIFSKKDLDTFLFHRKYDHKIILKKEHQYGYAFYIKYL